MNQKDFHLPDAYQLIHRHTVGSTMDEASVVAQQQVVDHPVVIVADQQNKGRGRKGRTWVSLPGNLYLSLLFKLPPETPYVAHYAYLAALCVEQALRSFPEVPVLHFKWPNDLMIEGKKLGGILLERVKDSSGDHCLVIGVGLNLQHAPVEHALYPVTVLNDHIQTPLAIHSLVEKLCHQFSKWQTRYHKEGFACVREAWLEHAYQPGDEMTVMHEKGAQEGYFHGIDIDGSLLLSNRHKKIIKILTGDVALVTDRGREKVI